MPSRTCSAAAPSITTPGRVSSCQLPRPGLMTKELPPRRAMAAWKEASVRSEGVRNSSARIRPASARGAGGYSRRRAGPRVERRAPRHEAAREELRLGSSRGAGGAQPRQEPRALVGNDRAHDAGLADIRPDPPHALEEALGLDGRDHRRDRRAGERSSAEGGAEGFGLERGGHQRRKEQRRAREAVAERLGGRE